MKTTCGLVLYLLSLMVWAEAPGAFLGVATRGLAPGESEALPRGVGLRVVEVVPDSPAALELETGDILHKLGDQLLVHPEQLAVLVGLNAPGDTVELTWRRGGETKSAQLTLGERPARATVQRLPVRPGRRGGLSGPGAMPPMMPAPMMPGGLEDRFLEMERRMEALRQEMERGFQGEARLNRRLEIRENDAVMIYEEENGHATLRVEEEGDVLFEGPVNTPGERAKIPEPYRSRLKREVEETMGAGDML